MSISNLFHPNDYTLNSNSFIVNDLTVNTMAIVNNFVAAGNATVNNNLTVGGAETVGANLSVGNNLSVTGTTILSGALTCNALARFPNNISFNSPYDTNHQLAFYEHVASTITFTGPWASDQTTNIIYERIGNCVTITITGFNVTGANATTINSTTGIPVDFIPNQFIDSICWVKNSPTLVTGNIDIAPSTGILIISVGFGGTFSTGSFVGFPTLCVTYSIN
jgi:hypothetical protein